MFVIKAKFTILLHVVKYHHEHTPKYFDPLKLYFYIVHVKLGFTGLYIIILISDQKHRLWVSTR